MNLVTIRTELSRLRFQVGASNESELWIWVLSMQLACAQRPLRDLPPYAGRTPLPIEAKPLVQAWVHRVVTGGFRSVISLLEEAQLDRYYVRGGLNLHPHGLLGYYESQGLQVKNLPCTDYQRPPKERMAQALDAFHHMPHPILLHCSAGIDRTAPVAEYIFSKSANAA